MKRVISAQDLFTFEQCDYTFKVLDLLTDTLGFNNFHTSSFFGFPKEKL